MTDVARPYRGRSAEERVAERRAALVGACLDIVAEQGPIGVTVEAVCLRAGLTKRYFYESFRDRDALLLVILDGFLSTLERGILAGIRDATAAERPRIVVEMIVDSLQADPRTARLFAEANALQVLRDRVQFAAERYVLLLREVVLPFRDHGAESLVAREVVSRVIVHGSTLTIAGWLLDGFAADREELVTALVAAGLGGASAV